MSKTKPLDEEDVQAGHGALIVPVFEEEDEPAGTVPDALQISLRDLLTDLIDVEAFSGEKEDVHVVHPSNGTIRAVIFCGLGPRSEASHERFRRAVGRGIQNLPSEGIDQTVSVLPDVSTELMSPYEIGRAYQEGIQLASYEFDEYRSENGDEEPIVHLYAFTGRNNEAFETGREDGERYARGTAHARDLANEPPSRMNPDDLVEEARGLAGNSVSVEVFREEELHELGMEPTLGVSAGSNVEPAQIVLRYRPDQPLDEKVHIGLAGKGVTFDSGGLNLKPLKSMMDMKFDMCGAAAVLGVFHVIDELEPPVPVTGICGCTENMTGPDAQKMRDVVHSYGGTSIEITHTDAEGRLVLSDALGYLEEQGVSEMIDLATLTGSVVTALGSEYAGLMSEDDALLDRLTTAVEQAGEQVWELPLASEYKSHLDSPVADVRNTGKKGEAGAITAGLFLQHFVKDCPWAHLDIAGTAWKDDGSDYRPEGGVGFGVRTLLEYIQQRAGDR